ncbi:MAG: hypothetical protein SGBAC_013562 [Bacillariaceae sp.]
MKSALVPSSESRYRDEGEPMTLSPSTKEVCFGRLEFREYPIIMGSNPSVSEGVPVTLDWDYFNVYDLEVDSYEIAANKAFTCTTGSRRCPRLDVSERAQMLLRQGYSMKDIVECTLEVLELKEGRSDSIRNRKWDGFNSFVEGTKRAVKRKTSSRKLHQPLVLQPPPPRRTDMPTPIMRRPRRRRSLEVTSTDISEQAEPIVLKIREKAPRRRSTLMVTDSMIHRTSAMSA